MKEAFVFCAFLTIILLPSFTSPQELAHSFVAANSSVICDLADGVAAVNGLVNADEKTQEMTKDKTKFVQEAVKELLRARRVLRFSYVYGYYLDPAQIGQQAKIIFEVMPIE